MKNQNIKTLIKNAATVCGINIQKFITEDDGFVCTVYMPVEGREDDYPDYWREDIFDPSRFDNDCSFIESKLNINTMWYLDKVVCSICMGGVFIEQHEYFSDYTLGKAQARRMASLICASEFYKESKRNKQV